jgi:hypothetical protein
MSAFEPAGTVFACYRSLTLLVIRIVAYFAIFAGCAAANSITFAQFTNNGAQNFTLMNMPDGSQTISVSDNVLFSYSNIPGLPPEVTGPLAATFTLTATSDQNVGVVTIVSTNYAYIGGFNGSFAFTAQGGGYNGHTNLLSGTFKNQTVLLGVQGGQSASFSDSTNSSNTSEVEFFSDVVQFAQRQQNFSISLSSIFDTEQGDAGFNVGGAGVDNFNAAATGTFASDPAPVFADEGVAFGYIGIGLVLLAGMAMVRRRMTKASLTKSSAIKSERVPA